MENSLPVFQRLYRAEQVRELDRLAIAGGIPGIQLMKHAGKAVFEVLLECWPSPGLITVYCGVGNNAGDGYVIAALAQQRQLPVCVIQVGDGSKLQGDAKTAFEFAQSSGVEIVPFAESKYPDQGVIVDALLGTGLHGEVRSPFSEAIDHINRSLLPVIAVDIPSGLHSDSGAVCKVAVKADLTVSFIGLKRGLYTAQGPGYCGEIFFDDLGVASDIYQQIPVDTELLDIDQIRNCLFERSPTTHKGDCGHVLLVGGEQGKGGAIVMAAEMACRAGAGLVSVATRPEHVMSVLSRRPEAMAHGMTSHHELLELIERATVVVVGPGLGKTAWSEQMLYHCLEQACARDLPMVLDADALNLLASDRQEKTQKFAVPPQLLLTPHPGEAARLLNVSVADIQQDRFAAASKLQAQYQASIVLKGAGTLVASGNTQALCPYGNPGMATGGMGDVLSGLLGGLLAQGLTMHQAARLGVVLHSYAADMQVKELGTRGLLATDLIDAVRDLINHSPI